MKLNIGRWGVSVSYYLGCAILFGSVAFSATEKTLQVKPGETMKVTGSILSRSGDLIQVREKKSNEFIIVALTDSTKIERKKSGIQFFRHIDMDVTAMVPGLTINAEGVGNTKGQLQANKISFTPDTFAVALAEEQQVIAHSAAIQDAQSTANEAQNSADRAQASAGEAGAEAKAAGTVAIMSADAVSMVNQRVSDLDNYKTESEIDVFFDRGSAVLKDTAKPALADLAVAAKSLDGYMIEISGYSSNTLSMERDQQLSEERAAAVVRYFTEVIDIPLRRILVPVGYGRTHTLSTNTDAQGRELNRRVDVKVLVNTALTPKM
jgi:outer membrane protein OmpA-like peptidoglycan-associated protein